VKISFGEIPAEGLVLDITDFSWFPDNEFSRVGVSLAQVTLREVHKRVVMDGVIDCPVTLTCDRCLAEYTAELKSDFTISFDWVGVKVDSEIDDEQISIDGEIDIVELEEPKIDIFATLRQQFYLMLPAKSICKKNCKGLCSQCGMDLNLGLCSCSGKDVDNPFYVLTKLKNN
jgi:uncharacterized protein